MASGNLLPVGFDLRLAARGTALALGWLIASVGAAAGEVDFNRDVLPILSRHCFECHGPDDDARQADLRLDTRETALAMGSELAAIEPGDPAKSAVIARITESDPDMRMPPPDAGDALSNDEIHIVRQWIQEGAEFSEHWAFIPAQRPAVPEIANAAWARAPLDRFVLERLEQSGLAPARPASREALIRRATFDLIGLPPTPAEVDAFVADRSPDAFRTLVDRLLASPHYGERWGRHWLDVTRYADSGGFETDIFFGHAWRYRDYVIRSLNADKRFDQFLREQIAGDELHPNDAKARIATGLYTIGPVLQEADMVDGKLDYDLLTDAVDTTGAAMLGMTLACARCHDHKYDPISQRDYYRMQAIFAASDQHDFDETGKLLRGGVALRKTIDQFELEQRKTRAGRMQNAQERNEMLREIGEFYIEQDRDLRRRLDEAEGYAAFEEARQRYQQALAANQSTEQLDALLREIGERSMELGGRDRRARRALRRLSREKRDALLIERGRDNLNLAIPEGLIEDADAFRREIGEQHLSDPSEIPVRALAHRERPVTVRVLGRGELSSPGQAVTPGFPAKLSGQSLDDVPPTRLRSRLAEWIASAENPLTPRVIVNRVWQWHFGQGLVRTPNDFGIRGERPTHPELLDWLAVEFVESGWSLKQLHRTIMLSNTYQMAAMADGETLARDPDNRLLTRYQPRRMEAEAIWDNLRAVAGTLNMEMYGLPFAPPLDAQEEIGNYKDWPTGTPDEMNRRGIYLLTRRSFRFPMLSAFDLPDNAASCGRRDITTVPNQCLTLLNNRTMQEQAMVLADRLLRETRNQVADVPALLWKYAYARGITPDERRQVTAFIDSRNATSNAAEKAEGAARRAVADLCLAVFNTSEFIYIQ